MNIQIFGSKKNADTRKTQRFFKERGIKFQFIDAKQKGLSKGELASVVNAVGGLDRLIDDQARDQKTLTLLKYLVEEQTIEKGKESNFLLPLSLQLIFHNHLWFTMLTHSGLGNDALLHIVTGRNIIHYIAHNGLNY